jgi:ubiquinone/menaquinone biosynthesis C-methylase UbiE
MKNTLGGDTLHEQTRKIYERQHERIALDSTAYNRISASYSAENWKVDPKWFVGKTALDAGCGNVGALVVRLLGFGCTKVYACDIGADWIPKLSQHLKSKGVSESQVELREGNVLRLPYEDKSFDFVASDGVLLHLKDVTEIERGFGEGARVCKKGGYYFTTWGSSGGLMQGMIMPAVRNHYRKDEWFKALIDNITPQLIHGVIDKICADSERYGGEKLDGEFLKSQFGEDFCVFLQNYIQAPQWWSNECTPEYVEGLYKEHGFVKIERLNEFVRRTDIRKYFAPLHYDRNHPVSKALYGNGYVTYIGVKA